MNKSDRRKAENKLRKYPNIKRILDDRIESIKHPTPPANDNVGGGKSNRIQKPEEELVIKLENDRTVKLCKRWLKPIDRELKDAPEIISRFVKETYFRKYGRGDTVTGYLMRKENRGYSKYKFYTLFNVFLHNILISDKSQTFFKQSSNNRQIN